MKGIVQKIATMPDGTVRFSVDVPTELAPDDLKAWLYEYVDVEISGSINHTAKGKTHGDKEGKKGSGKRTGKAAQTRGRRS